MKLLLSTAAVLIASASASVCMAATHQNAGKKYTSSHISFTYPSSWKALPKSLQSSFRQQLSSSAGTSAKVVDLGAVYTVPKKGQATIAVLAQMGFNKKFQKELKGNHQAFVNKFDHGIKQEAAKVISNNTHASFAGQNNANELQIIPRTGGHDAFFIAIASNDKTVALGVMVVEPTKQWSKFSGMLNSIASSSRFK